MPKDPARCFGLENDTDHRQLVLGVGMQYPVLQSFGCQGTWPLDHAEGLIHRKLVESGVRARPLFAASTGPGWESSVVVFTLQVHPDRYWKDMACLKYYSHKTDKYGPC